MNTSCEVLNRIDSWRDKKIRYEPLGGGITNHNFTVYIDDKPYVVRIPGAGTEIFIDRDNELECSIQAGKTGIAPEVINHLKPENILVIPFIKGKTLTTGQIKGDNDIIVRIIKAVKIFIKMLFLKAPSIHLKQSGNTGILLKNMTRRFLKI